MPEHTIAENLTRLQNAKTAIGNAITAKGGTVAAGDGLEDFAADIATITNQYTAADEGKVVSSGSLVAQTSTTATANGTIDTTTNNEVVVNVPNTYTVADEGKVVSNGALVAQTAYPSTITVNGTYNTTENNSVTVNVPSLPSGIEIVKLTPTTTTAQYLTQCDMWAANIYNQSIVFGSYTSQNPSGYPYFSYPDDFVFSKTTSYTTAFSVNPSSGNTELITGSPFLINTTQRTVKGKWGNSSNGIWFVAAYFR